MSIVISDFLTVKSDLGERLFQNHNYNAPRAFNLAYLNYRIRRPLLKKKYQLYQKKHPNAPWLCPDAIKALSALLHQQGKKFEFGSGRSTLFFAPFFQTYYSVEHNADWFEKVKNDLKCNKITHAQLKHIPSDTAFSDVKLSSEQQFSLSATDYPLNDDFFQTYSSYISTFPDKYFDFVLVDGRSRRSCALNAIPKLKTGGILVLDNSERKRYEAVHDALDSWEKIFTTTGLTDTSIWLKPGWE